MDLTVFVQSLTQKEQQELFLILKAQFRPGELETVREFFERHMEDVRMSQRLATSFREALEHYKRFPEHSCLNKPVKDVGFDDLYAWKGTGKKTWTEFIALRGY